MEIALVLGLIVLGLFALVYFGLKFIDWLLLPEGEFNDSGDSSNMD